jgi:nitroreductase
LLKPLQRRRKMDVFAAIQNMHLAAHALGLGSLWLTFFEKKPLRERYLALLLRKHPWLLYVSAKQAVNFSPYPERT